LRQDRPGQRCKEGPERAREMVLAVLRDQHATESDLSVAGKLLCDMPRVDDQWATDLLSVVRNRDAPVEVRVKGAVHCRGRSRIGFSWRSTGPRRTPISPSGSHSWSRALA
jgi:hypothetical protein